MSFSIKRNILANYVSQFYVVLIGIVMVPVYIRYMGAEAYGLIGFYAMLQAWFQLLDMGLTPTMARETARFSGNSNDPLKLRRLLRTLEGIFIVAALLGAGGMIVGSGFIANSWLRVQQLPLDEVQRAIMLMAVIVALRWQCGLFRGAITGFERLVWLGGFNIAVATARFVLVIPFFIYVGAKPTQFFTYQLTIALVEVTVLVIQTYHLMPKVGKGQRVPWQLKPLSGVLKFSLSIAFASSVWVLVSQTDKLVMSKLLALTDYAYFTLAVLVANGVIVISGPISMALLPRLTKLNAEGDEEGMIHLYRNSTQMVGIVALSGALVLAFFSEQVLWAWTGDADIARKTAQVLTLYALGNGMLALATFPYFLQFAKGDLKLHLIGSALFIMIFIPMLLLATWKYGMVGAGYAWVIANLLLFVIWVPIVHRRFFVGLHIQWLRDVRGIVLLTLAWALLSHALVKWPHGRLSVTLILSAVFLTMLTIASAGSAWVREKIRQKWRARSGK